MEWARVLKRKSFTSGAIDDHAVPGQSGSPKGSPKKVKVRQEVKETGAPRATSGGQGKRRSNHGGDGKRGICYSCAGAGKCENCDDCPYSHIAYDQLQRDIGD